MVIIPCDDEWAGARLRLRVEKEPPHGDPPSKTVKMSKIRVFLSVRTKDE